MRAAGALLWLAAAATAATDRDQDFEFVENADVAMAGAGGGGTSGGGGGVRAHKPRPYVYDPNNALCAAVTCGARELCVVHRGERALCVRRRRPHDHPAPPSYYRDRAAAAAAGGAGDEDALYVAGDDDDDFDLDLDDVRPEQCVGCGRGAAGSFLCGSDNRTYSSLCRLDLHNCVRRARPPVTVQCRGFCPCATPAPPPAARRTHRARKHRQYSHEMARRHRDELTHNESVRDRTAAAAGGAGDEAGAGCSLDTMAARLLDWFSVLMEQARVTTLDHQATDEFPAGCQLEVRWMFSHLDTDGDGLLSADNLYALRHDERERCLRPFLSTCGSAADGDVALDGVTRAQWCGCLRRAARPCTQLARAHPTRQPGEYVPACDSRGDYLPRQCHPALRMCWCVDRHGQERAGSRTRGRPRCPTTKGQTDATRSPVRVGAGRAPADDEDGGGGGSGDVELAYQ